MAEDLTLLIETANAPIFGIDADGMVNEWNRKAVEITGFSNEEVMGRSLVSKFITAEYQEAVQEVLQKALGGPKRRPTSSSRCTPRTASVSRCC